MSRTGRPIANITGMRFGKLVVLGSTSEYRNGNITWKCLCDCGNTTFVEGRNLKRGHTKSCGCLHDLQKNPMKQANPRIYNIWLRMKDRCYNKNYAEFYLYGGRDIKVCDQWLYSFNEFAKWALEHKYSNDLSIDRISVNGNYEPSNCRWATNIEQANNKRNNRNITVNGITHTLSEWSRITGINRKTLQSCLTRHGEAAMCSKFQDSLKVE